MERVTLTGVLPELTMCDSRNAASRIETAGPRRPFRRIFTLLLLLVAFAQGCATSAPVATLPIDEAISRAPFDRAFWSVLVEDDDGRVMYARNSDKLTIPASNRKLFTAAAILNCLGGDAQLRTAVRLDGSDLVLVGDGDPSLGSSRYERQEDFVAIAELLRDRGVTAVRDVVADVSRFDRRTIPGGWKNGNLGSGYAAPVDAIAWRENQFPDGRAVPDAALNATTALRDALLTRGIAVTGIARVNTEPRTWGETIAEIPSPFVGHLLMTVLKNSHNLYAEMLLKRTAAGNVVLGREPIIAPATYDEAFALEEAFLLREAGLESGTFRFVDGSGLAPDNLVTPEATVRMLRWMNEPSRRGLWWSLLPQPAGEGTLRNRLVALEERVRAKTGTVEGGNALSGIIAMPGGGFRYFSIAVNHHIGEGSQALAIIDEIVRAIAQ
jgi:serine-type D-Ala-D-Ala carboxypeptidase/endopeptidase (penicillin-binding protein 4)